MLKKAFILATSALLCIFFSCSDMNRECTTQGVTMVKVGPDEDAAPSSLPLEINKTAYTERQSLNFKFNETDRPYLLFLPENEGDEANTPMVFIFHGGGNAHYSFSKRRSWLIDKTLEEGFVVVIPQGTPGPTGAWNAMHCCGYALMCDVDDVGYIRALVNHLISELDIDTSRIYATGHSNGGFLTHRVAVELSDIFAAVAPGAATIGGQADPESAEERIAQTDTPMPIMMYHGENDGAVNLEGGSSKGNENARIDLPLTESVAYWTTVNGCSGEPTETTDLDATISDYEECDHAPVKVVIISDLGHGYPDPDILEPGEGVDFDFASMLLQFFKDNPKQ